MAERYFSRRFRMGDEGAINELYYAVTGNHRTKSEFSWQWLEAPIGPAEIFLIEAEKEDGAPQLIGHHGVMPIAFSHGNEDLVFGKTENTMVLPDYRSKILYPRYEKRFLKEYEGKFDALFSTLGPSAAIRQRRAMGYSFGVDWKTLRVSTGRTSEALFILTSLQQKLINVEVNRSKQLGRLLRYGFMTDDQALRCDFFDDFWDRAKLNFSIAPRRQKCDLSWRFWLNPNKEFLTFVIDSVKTKGYGIITFNDLKKSEVVLEDFCVESNSADEARRFFLEMLNALRAARIYSISITCTEDSSLYRYNFLDTLRMFSDKIVHPRSSNFSRPMPRKIAQRGSKSISTFDWDVTGIVFEGR